MTLHFTFLIIFIIPNVISLSYYGHLSRIGFMKNIVGMGISPIDLTTSTIKDGLKDELKDTSKGTYGLYGPNGPFGSLLIAQGKQCE